MIENIKLIYKYIEGRDNRAIEMIDNLNISELESLSDVLEPGKYSVLHIALLAQQKDVIEIIINKCPTLLSKDYPAHRDLLTFCSSSNCQSSAETLITLYEKNKIDTQKKLDLALLITANSGFEKFLEFLISEGAKPTAFTDDNDMAIHCAIRKRHQGVLDILTSSFGKDVVNQCKHVNTFNPIVEARDTPLHCCFKFLNKYPTIMYSMVSRLLEFGADVNLTNVNGLTALHLALSNKKLAFDEENNKLIALLLKYGADIEILSLSGESPLSMAVDSYNKVILDLLLENYSPKNLDYLRSLQSKASGDNLKSLEMFISKNALIANKNEVEESYEPQVNPIIFTPKAFYGFIMSGFIKPIETKSRLSNKPQ